MRLVLLGAPGAGKGTQAATLSKHFGVPHVATGDIFRAHQREGTELGLLAKSYMEKGLLVPDEITVRMLLERISQPDCARGYVLDGFPRTVSQAKALDEALGQRGESIDRAVYVRVSTEELMRRLGGRWICRQCQAPYHEVNSPPKVPGRCDRCGGELYQRSDDQPEAIEKRLEVYLSDTAPVIDYYRAQSKLVEVNGERSIEEVGKETVAALA